LNFKKIAQDALIKTLRLISLHKELSRDIKFMTIRSFIYYNRKRLKELTLKEDDPVYLLRKNIKTKRLSLKLDYIKLGPFKIQKILSKIIYRLKLSNNM
jgi:hypothetical protein